MSLASALPAPINVSWDNINAENTIRGLPSIGALVSARVAAPPYGKRKGWIPRSEADFGDGGAFPEIQVVQYPLGKSIERIFLDYIINLRDLISLNHRYGRTAESQQEIKRFSYSNG